MVRFRSKNGEEPMRDRSTRHGSARSRASVALAAALALVGASCSDAGPTAADRAPTTAATQLRVEVLARRPHATDAFTEGLVLHDGTLYESTGNYGASQLRATDPVTGAVRQSAPLADRYFGEGLAKVGDRLVQLTWKEQTAFVYDAANLVPVGHFSYDGEGWGLCDDGTRLVMSNGSDTLTFRDRTTFAVTGTVAVRDGTGQPVDELNELECVGGEVYANVWRTDTIVRIDPATGRLTATIDASGLLPSGQRVNDEAVLNGIAYDATRETFLLTGKFWPALFEVRFVAR
jgi:glutaminyl-peptide cyclotransferase